MTRTTITTLIFDVDDTLYDVSTGFTAHRNGTAVHQFMVDYLDFPNHAAAQAVRDEYFARYHATAKALTIAEQEGRFPPSATRASDKPRFRTADLAEYWATHLQFDLLTGGPQTTLLRDLRECPLQLVAFSNGPRKYVQRVLRELGLFDVFGEDRLFCVDDVLPACKPEPKAFQVIFDKVGVRPEECVMVEDSMKNIRAAKKLGMKTVLVTGKGRMQNRESSLADAAEATKPGDAPLVTDPAVDVAIETVEEMRAVLPGLWETPAHFSSRGDDEEQARVVSRGSSQC